MTVLLVIVLVLLCIAGLGVISILLRVIRLDKTPDILEYLRGLAQCQHTGSAGPSLSVKPVIMDEASHQPDGRKL